MVRSKSITTFMFLAPMVLFFFVLNVVKFEHGDNQEYVMQAEDFDQLKRLKLVVKDSESLNQIQESESKLANCDCAELLNKSEQDDKLSILKSQSERKSDPNSMYNLYLVQNEINNSFPTVFVITPTYFRPTQMPDLTRLSQTLMLVKNIFWIVVEDSKEYNKQVRDLLLRTKLPYAHLLGPRSATHMDKRSGRGVSNRLKALEWLRQKYTNTTKQGVLYFADDDNSYDIRLFEEMRYTKKVSVFPVGMLAKTGISSPIVKDGKVTGFHDPWYGNRIFAVDMAGFAVNLQYFLSNPKATMPYKVGYEEDYFIRSLGAELADLEPKANNCTEVLVWHTKTQMSPFPSYSNIKNINSSNLMTLYKNILNTKLCKLKT